MRSDGIVVTPPLLDHNLRFRARSKPFKAQAFISELAVEALVRAVLPRLAGIAKRHVHAVLCSPLQGGPRYELWAVVRTQVTRCTMKADQLGQDFDDTSGTNRSGHVDCQAFTRVLIDHRQTLQLLAVGARVEYEVVRPNVSCRRRRLRPRALDRHASTGSLARHLQPGKTPQPPSPVGAHRVTLPLQKDLDAAVTITRILRRQNAHRCQHRRVPHGQR
ncbi:Uncharacterised protein [Burkholderia pseudomallei]|nr:Uncharacterised protein [Burkholderia pseudomallei]